jgi:hypothetical protein
MHLGCRVGCKLELQVQEDPVSEGIVLEIMNGQDEGLGLCM